MEPYSTLALGLDLRLTATADGGRRTPVGVAGTPLGEFQYRPDWALPRGPQGLTAAPVVGFSRTPVAPGESARAVITPLLPHSLPLWQDVRAGEVLRMHEGARVCGLGTVVWVEDVTLPLAGADVDRVRAWLASG